MTEAGAPHQDVAAYALGVLDEAGAARFEEHLARCPGCAVELESLLPVTGLLAGVDAADVVGAEQVLRDDRMLTELLSAVRRERGRLRTRRLLAVAAGVIALVLAAGLSLLAGAALDGGPSGDQRAGGGQRRATAGPPDPGRTGAPGPGIGGPGAVPGAQFGATDPTTGVQGSVRLLPKEWGTEVSLAVSAITGPLTCQLVAVGPDGLGEVVYTWSVPATGYGTSAHPEALLLQGATALPRSSIDRVEIQSVDPAGRTALLVAIDV